MKRGFLKEYELFIIRLAINQRELSFDLDIFSKIFENETLNVVQKY